MRELLFADFLTPGAGGLGCVCVGGQQVPDRVQGESWCLGRVFVASASLPAHVPPLALLLLLPLPLPLPALALPCPCP